MPFTGVVYQRGHGVAALTFATALRKCGEAVDLPLTGKPQRQFEKLRASGAWAIVEVGPELNNYRLWRAVRNTVSISRDEALSYFYWINDETGLSPEPDERILAYCADDWER